MFSPKAKRNNHGLTASVVSVPPVTLPPLYQDQQRLSAFAFKPLSGRTSVLEPHAPPKTPVSVLELPRLIAQVGPEKAIGDTRWMEGPRLMASALSTDIPVRSVRGGESTTQSLTDQDESMIITIKRDRKTKRVKETVQHRGTLSGTDVVEILAMKRLPREFDFYYLKEVDEDSFRPYDLRVVHPSEAGSQHYVFSPSAVLHVTEKGYGGFVSLEEWYRESVLWRALRELSFFRDYPLRKAFTRWHRNVCKITFQRKCDALQNMLLMAVPQFRNGLFLLSRVIEEVKETHWLPQDESNTYTVLEFKNILTNKNKQWMGMIEKLLHYRAVVLNMVQEDSYRTCQELQFRVERSKTPREHQQPLHLQLAHHREWKKELVHAEDVMQKLGNMATLVDQMVMQGLVTVTRREVLSFLHNVTKREKPLFRAQLVLSADGQLTVDPAVHLFDGVVREALLTVGDSAVQMLDAYGFFHENNDSEASSTFRSSCASELTPDLNLAACSALTGDEEDAGMTGLGSLSYRCQSDHRPALPELSLLEVQGHRLRGCYHPLLKKQLDWQLRHQDLSEEVEREQARIMQEIQSEIQQLCEEYAWLADIHLFTSQWGPACLEALRDQPVSLYEKHFEKVCLWTERMSTLPPSFTTSNNLFVIHCAHIQEKLGLQLNSIVGEVKAQLVEEMKQCSETLISDLKRSISELNTEPVDFYHLNKYASMVKQCERNTADVQLRLERVRSLQDTICKSCRKMTKQEVTLEAQMLSLWRCYVPLLKQAEQTVCQRVPSVADALDHTFSSLVNDLDKMASDATSGPFLDPTQNADEMFSKLSDVCGRVRAVGAKLKELSGISENLRGHPLDLAVVVTAMQTLEARKGLWELMSSCTSRIREWKQLQLSEFVASYALEQVDMWQQQAASLSRTVPTNDAVLLETLGILEHFNQQLSVMDRLCSPGVTHKHWSNIFKGMGRTYSPDMKLTVDDLTSKQFGEHQEIIGKICREAEAEWGMRQALLKLQRGWEARLFGLAALDEPHDRTGKEYPAADSVSSQQHPVQQSCGLDTFIITDLEVLLAETEDSVMTLSNMLTSPHVAEFRPEVEHWVHLLQELEELLDFFERYQQTWIFLAKMFSKTTIRTQRVELLERFHPVDKTFRDIIHSISSDPHVLNIAQSEKTNNLFRGSSLRQILINDLSTVEDISNQMLHVPRGEFPRLCFLSDREVIKLLSLRPTPSTLLPAVRKCFQGVRRLEVDCEMTNDELIQMKIPGVFGSFNEHIAFQCPVEPSVSPLVCLGLLEKQLLQTMMQLMKDCIVARTLLEPSGQDSKTDTRVEGIKLLKNKGGKNMLPMLNLVSDYPLQCLLVAEEVAWCSDVLRINQASGPAKWNRIKTHKSSILKTLCHVIREGITGAKEKSQVSNRTVMFLCALVQLTMNHAQQISKLMDVLCELASSFEWQSSLKYHMTSHDQSKTEKDFSYAQDSSDYVTCYVDVLGTRLLYGYEYLGPEHCMMVNTPSTERAVLGILLALTSYRCGFVSGPSMSGKKRTVVQLGRALGRQVIALQCYFSTSLGIVQQMLLGALQTGAWLVLDGVDSLKQGTLSLLGQHLADIHQSFSECKTILQQKVHREPRDRMTNMNQGCQSREEFPMSFAGRDIFAKLGYGCVVISSTGHTAEVPESLRVATRPIAFMHPDYRVITEVMLASIGFSEATSLSQCLVSLFSIAKDSNCLPEFINEDQIGLLVVLQKITAASGVHLDASSSTVIYHRQSAAIVQGLAEEKAVVKAFFSTFLPYICEPKKASQFRTLLEETFPMAKYYPFVPHHTEEEEQNVLRDAVKEELQRAGLQPDTQTICNALALYQAMKFSQAVLLIGPPGSGKSTCYRVLARALHILAARTAEHVDDGDQTELQIPFSNWHSVDTVVLFPNAMSNEEVFGYCREEGGWWDGAFTKVLRDSERHDLSTANSKIGRDQTQKVKWLVMDGEPLGQPGWLDCFSTLCNPDDPSLYLSSGEKLVPSQSKLKLLAEITDLKNAAPSAVSRCSLVHFTGADLWKAVWKVEMDALCRERSLDEGTLKMWNRLAEDLFCRTLDELRDKALISVLHSEGNGNVGFSKPPTYGLQEIMSFFKIIQALLEHFGRDSGSKTSPRQTYIKDMPVLGNVSDTDIYVISTQKEVQARDIFLVAYIWGFGGHLHPRHWPQFDTLARQVLFNSRYRVEVPDEGTIFEHFFNQSEEMIADIINGINCPRVRDPCLAGPVIPQYEKHVYLLNLMLEAKQPVMLVGEASSGKTMLCRTLLNQDRGYISLAASPLLSSRDMRRVLNNMSAKTAMRRQSGLLLFVDDLHEAPCDAFGKTSMALETLRQSVSKGHIQTYDGYHFKCLSCRGISYMATCCTSRSGHGSGTVISSRLSRLFSTFVLPSLSADVLFSLHSPRLKLWLKDLPCSQGSADMARCIIGATQHLFHAVCEQFPPTAQRPHYMFSHHDLQKVFQGMCLWQPCNTNTQPDQEDASLITDVSKSSQTGIVTASVLNIVHLWMHECLRTFSDRLFSIDEGNALVSLIARVSAIYYGSKLVDKSSSMSLEDTSTAMIPTTSTVITDNLKSSSQSLDTPNKIEADSDASSSQLAPEALLDLTTAEVVARQSGKPSSIELTSSDSSSIRSHGTKEDISFSKDENTVQYKKVAKKDQLILQDASLSNVLIPSPPKGPKPAAQSERGHRFTEHSVQNEGIYSEEPSSASCQLPSQLLQDMEQTMNKIVYGPEITDPVNSIAQQYDFKRDASYQERDFDLLLQQLSATVKRQEEHGEKKSDDGYIMTSGYAVHRQRTHQLLHILRALLIPGGHGVLFGAVRGTGRKSNVRLAACLTGYQLMEVHPGNEQKLREILKEAICQTEVNSANVVILAHEEISQAVREELLMVMASGTCPGLYSEEELQNLVPRVNGVKNPCRCHTDPQALETHFRQFQRNMHAFLLLPLATPEGLELPHYSTQAWKAHITKALSLSCCVEVYQPWSRQSLVEAATHCLQDNLWIPELHGKLQRRCLEASMPLAMATIHKSACRYASVLLKTQPFSPQTYMEFISHFFYLSSHLYKQGQQQANRVTAVLARLEVMTDTAVQYKHNVITLQENVAQAQQCEKELLRAMAAERILCERARQNVVLAQIKLCQLEEQIHHTKHKESPLFQLSLKILQCLSSSDLEEVRRYTNPPEGVVKIMDALCLLFNRPCNWESAKQLLVQSNFFQELEFFDRHGLTKSQLQALGQIVNSPHFQPECVRGVSHACESLCNWVRAVYEYACLERRMAAQGVSKQCLGKLAKEAHAGLVLARLRKEEAFRRLADTERELQFVQEELVELCRQLSGAQSLERHAAAVLIQMQRHSADWNTAAQEAEVNNQTLPGDALILAAAISYLGPFGADIRTELLHKWRELCLTGTMNLNPEDPRTSLFTNTDCFCSEPILSDAIPVAEKLQWALARALGMEQWHFLGLPARLVVKLLLWGCRSPWVRHWPLLVDTQHHQELIAELEKEPEYGMVLCADDPELLDKLKQAAVNGVRVLVRHVERAVPSPQLLAVLVRHPHRSAGLRRPPQPAHPDFCLFLSTHLPVRLLSSEIHPSILAEVQVVDLALSSAETQELLLSQLLLPSECMEALRQQTRVSREKRALQDKLLQEEASLMDYVLQSSAPLQDPKFLRHVVARQEASQRLHAEVERTNVELELYESQLSAAKGAVRLAAGLYRDLQDVARTSPVYFFPLRGFITAMGEALLLKGDSNVSNSNRRVTEGMISEVTHRMASHLLAQYQPRLFRSHGALLKLLMSVTLLQHQGMCSEAERAAFLRGLGDLDMQEQEAIVDDSPLSTASPGAAPRRALPGWIPPQQILPELVRLEKVPSFRGLLSSLASSPRQWKEYLRFPSSTVAGTVPCSSHSHLSLLQRALLWKTLLPHSLEAVAESLAVCNLGLSGSTAAVEAPHCGDPEGLSRLLVTHEGPVVLALPAPGGENWSSVQPLHLLKQLTSYRADANRVQLKVISFGGKCETEVILSALDRAVTDGHWLVFNNCHLLDRWDEKVMLRLNQLALSSRGYLADVEADEVVHPNFRLWFITRGYTSGCIPAAVRMRALHVACDCPRDVKEELGSSLSQVLSAVQSAGTCDNMEPFIRCATVHSVLLQRQSCKNLGQSSTYHWTQEDLQVLVEAHVHIASRCENKMEALEYIAVNLVHGGHVSDPADLEAVASVVKACLNTASPLRGSGPHVLRNIINIPGHFASGCFDVSGLLQGLEQYTQDLAYVSDPLILGFGADLAAEIIKANGHALNNLLRDSQVPRGKVGGRSNDRNNHAMLPDYGQSRDRLQALKSTLATKDTRTVTSEGTIPHGPMRDFLLAEWDGLCDLVSSLISQLKQPSQHSKPAATSSLLAFADLSRLERRAELLRAYLWDEACEDTPTAYCLSTFSNARGFLVAVRREAAQAQRKDVRNVGLHFQVLSVFPPPASPLAQGGVYLCGLELRGALWDTRLGALQDTLSPQPCSLPLLHIRPGVGDSHTALYNRQHHASHMTNTDATRVSDAPQLPVYHCPLYLDQQGDGGEWGRLADASIVTRIPLAAKLNPVLCSLRRVRLVSTL